MVTTQLPRGLESFLEKASCPLLDVRNSETEEITLMYPGEIRKEGIQLGRYRHFKGNEYEVLGITTREDQEFVVYKKLYGDMSIWMRPKEMFIGFKEEGGKKIKRFEYVGE